MIFFAATLAPDPVVEIEMKKERKEKEKGAGPQLPATASCSCGGGGGGGRQLTVLHGKGMEGKEKKRGGIEEKFPYSRRLCRIYFPPYKATDLLRQG